MFAVPDTGARSRRPTAVSRFHWTRRFPSASPSPAIGARIPARIVEERSERERLAALVEGLPPRQRQVVLLHYFNGKSLRAIGRQLAISPQRASQLHTSAIAGLKRLSERQAYAAPH